MYIFLQNWRTTLVPAIAVPVVLLGTFGVLAAVGYSINTLTLFALVLVIGLLVDDAIVVVENVERIMREEGLPPRDATLHSMTEITGALIGIGLVLTAVFLPMAFFGGSTGVIYRQFSVTIVSAMLLSIMCALVLTPALCATLLKPYTGEHAAAAARWAASSPGSTAISSACRNGYRARWPGAQPSRLVMLVYAVIVAAAGRAVLPPAHRLSAGRGPGLRHHPDHPAVRRHPGPHHGGGQPGGAIISSTTKRTMSISSSPWRASASPAPARMPASPSPICATGMSARASRTAPTAIAQRAMMNFFMLPDGPGLCPGAAGGAGTGQLQRLRHRDGRSRQSGPCRPDPGAQHAAGPGGARSRFAGRFIPTAWTTRRSCMSISTRPRPMRWASPPPTPTPPCRRPGAAASSTISSTAPASSASICRATRPSA